MLEIPVILSLVALGLLVGIVSSLIGVGGGFFIVPTLVLAYHLNTQQAIGTSLGMTVFTAVSGTVAYLRQKRIDWRIGLVTAALSIPSASIGAYTTSFVSSRMLAFLFGIMQVILALRILLANFLAKRSFESDDMKPQSISKDTHRIWHRNLVDAQGNLFHYDVRIFRGLGLLSCVGFAAGLLGVGGGLMIVPVYTMVMGIPIHLAVATSLFVMIFTAFSGVSVHVALGNVLTDYVVSLAVGIVFGAQIGARFSRRLSRRRLEVYFGLALLVIGVVLTLTRLPA
ncbi:MAG: sulfite exporter TauE/SafE family protein [Thaumarchaeota archaeon]|nr:sulfite exporter TauE/SafE family protein [Nitrososphaerota archaeon]